MKHKEFIKKIVVGLFCIGGLASCAIENDIPYPIVEGAITGITVEGQRGPKDNKSNSAAVINTNARTVSLYVNDSVDITNLKITQLQVSNNAEILPDSAACVDVENFPTAGFSSLDSVSNSTNTRVNFSKPVNFTLRTYQDYVWKVTVNQIIDRDINVEGMQSYTIDEKNHRIIIYVGQDQDLSNIQIQTLNLGGEFGEVRTVNNVPITDVHDFSSGEGVEFYARLNWEDPDDWTKWTVFVFHSASGAVGSSSVFPMCVNAYVTGTVQSGQTPVIEYREQSSSSWETLDAASVSVSGTSYSATITGLTPGTAYSYRVSVEGETGEEQSFTTVQSIALENGSLENWSEGATVTGRPYVIPNAEGSDFWGTGNPGAAAFIDNLTTQTTESVSGTAARLESKDAIIKLGAGNLFTGDFTLNGIDGLLHFGRPFTSFPTALRLYYKYTSTEINEVYSQAPSYMQSFIGNPDTCHIYIALSDKSEPYVINTDPTSRQLFDKNDANIIAYGEFLSAQTTSSYQQIEIPLTYRATNRTPKYIIIVCAASKWGDYYVGGVGSTLWLDEMELVYE